MRSRWPPLCAILRSAVVAVALSASAPAWAAEPSPEAKEEASALFSRGEALFEAGDPARAAELFERAEALAPHPDILWNVARSWERAGEAARAADAYAAYLSRTDERASGRGEAALALERLARKVGRLEIGAAGAPVWGGERRVAGATRYVTPGTHVVRFEQGERRTRQIVAIEAGQTRSVTAAEAEPESPLAARARPSGAEAQVPSARRGIPVAWFVVGASATAIAAGLAVAFAVDTESARARFDERPSEAAFDEGREKQHRTNVTLGVAAGLAAVTAVVGLAFVDWKGPTKRTSVRLSPSFVGLGGHFD